MPKHLPPSPVLPGGSAGATAVGLLWSPLLQEQLRTKVSLGPMGHVWGHWQPGAECCPSGSRAAALLAPCGTSSSAEGCEGFLACVSAGTFRGVCKKIDHFPEDADYEQDTAEYLLRESAFCVRHSHMCSLETPHCSSTPFIPQHLELHPADPPLLVEGWCTAAVTLWVS